MKRIGWSITLCCGVCLGTGIGISLAQTPDQSSEQIQRQQPNLLQQLPFSAARSAGDTIYLSGAIPVKPDGTFEQGDTSAQTRQTMENLNRTLKENGCTFDDVVKVTVYLKSMQDYQEMNAVYRTFFSGPFPARECVGGLEIAFGSDVEISLIAYKAR